jgi:hypothetical protein
VESSLIRASFDLTVPLMGDGGPPGGPFVVASLLPWTGTGTELRALGVLVNSTSQQEFTVTVLEAKDSTVRTIGNSLTKSRGAWVRIMLTARIAGKTWRYESEIVDGPNTEKAAMDVDGLVTPADSVLFSIGSDNEVPAPSTEVLLDTVTIASRESSTNNP